VHQGEDVTVESIKTELNNAKNYVQSEKFKESATSVGERFAEIFRIFFKIVFGLVGAVLGIAGVVLVGALIMLLFFLVFEPTVINGFAPDFISNWGMITPDKMVMLIISLLLVVGCPIFMLIYWAVRIISGRREKNHTASWVVLILWLAGLFMFYSVGANTIIKMHNNNGHPFSIDWSDDNSSTTDEVRTCEPFHAIDVSGAIELTLRHDSAQQVTVSTKEAYLSKIITKVENGVLHIYADEIFLNRKVKVNVSADSITSIVAKGACQINTESDLITSNLKLDLTGASEADMDLKVAGLVDVNLTGASHANLNGSAASIKSEGIGACQLEAKDLITKKADIRVTGASHANVYATESLDASAFGASEIDCKGSPKNVNKSNIGSEIHVE